MLLTHHMDNFKPNLTHPNPRHDSLPSTLPIPKHSLPARPPAEVCVNISTNTQPGTPLSSQSQPRGISIPPPNTPSSEKPKHATASPPDPAPHTSNSDEISPYDFQDITETPIEPPFFREDTVEDGPSSPSMSSSDDSLKEFFRLPDIQNDIPIDPLILANDGPWEASDLHQTVLQDDSLIVSETICPYPEPPPILHHVPDHHRVSSERPRSQNGNIQTRDHAHAHAHIHLPLFALVSCACPLMNVCSSFLGCSKAPCHVACLTLVRQRGKTEMRSQPVAQFPSMRLNKLSAIAGRPKAALGRGCHGPLKRRAFC
ncbi:hypothetical protein BDV33DRAFT_195537 [Aspergillus novoparasiticus]|uniref:Uncharacterized protein n=1 Tax=Aspergillus novoparasiticus TaxID=986946 RepID=A0A5N6ECT9_9EURO|nr:hypothetical protein BDV33DRAFT_195537 [Aspergillus novoparasiticus]